MADALTITRRDLRHQASRQGVSLGALEKDYVLTLILQGIYAEEGLGKTLIFKGGTALHKVYLHRRLSLDLDFTANVPISLETIRPALEIPEIDGQIKDAHEYDDALTIDRLGFVGPLQHPNSVKIDVSFREKIQLMPRRMVLTTVYGPSFAVTCMALEEILAEKIRAALMRRTPRDYFDLWLMFQRDEMAFEALPDLVRAKLCAVGHPYRPDELWESPDVLERLWIADLRQLVRDVPPFTTMFAELQVLFHTRLPETL
ncbi:MAG: nucleotidyl transferase AbiEii/AbiGii toxin family protein [Chloroflexota bacterium]